jgi:hypothetical protein
MNILLTREQVELLNYDQCCRALKKLAKTYNLNKPLSEMTREEFLQVDDIANALLYLEDRIAVYEDPRITSMDPQAQTIPQPEPKTTTEKKPREYSPRPSRSKEHLKFRVLDKVYDNIHQAQLSTGITLRTLKVYASRKRDRYGYITE